MQSMQSLQSMRGPGPQRPMQGQPAPARAPQQTQQPRAAGAPMQAPKLKAGAMAVLGANTMGKLRMVASGPGQDPSEAGVGLMFNTLPSKPEEAFVKEIVFGGSAWREGFVQVGDIILSVDGQDVNGSDLARMRQLVLGEIGTFVTLQFLRRTPDGQENEYTISLIRGSQPYFEKLTQKSRMQEEVDLLRQKTKSVEEERETLRRQVADLENQSSKEQEKLEDLRHQLGVSGNALRSEQDSLKRAEDERIHDRARIDILREQKDNDTRNLEQLRGWLDQAQDKLTGAHESLKATREHKSEMEERYQQETQTRAEVENIESQLITELENKMEEDRKFREDREHELLALEEERRKYEKLVNEMELDIEEEERKRQVVEARNAKVQQQVEKVEEVNQRLETMLKEAADARSTIEQAKTDAEAKNKEIEEELLSIDEQSAKRQGYIEELKAKLESERLRLEQELRNEQDGRKRDTAEFKHKEENMLRMNTTASEEVKFAQDDQAEKKNKFESNITRLEQEVKSFEAALQAEESLSDALRERCVVLNEQLEMIEEELSASKTEQKAANGKLQKAEEEKLKALERERAMSVELQKEVDGEGDKLASIEAIRKQFEDDRLGKEAQLHEAKANQRRIEVEKQEAEHSLRCFRDEGQLMVDNERRRIERELSFKKSHEDYIEQFGASVRAQEDLAKFIADVKIPLEEYTKYADESGCFPDTTPKFPRSLEPQPLAEQLSEASLLQQGAYPAGERVINLSQSMHVYPQGERITNLSQSMHAYHMGSSGLAGREQVVSMGGSGLSSYHLGSSYGGPQVSMNQSRQILSLPGMAREQAVTYGHPLAGSINGIASHPAWEKVQVP